eukprot:TRINITY_DN81652_c0_g1_i1.p1 TRINITY_DN81652_c0_g1~~TRINITY_DN81652_c0_g1_i1.p1  ORF type:complete len:360 (+),score=49.20 TRINITY_DN81652_c0_g1_i1:151-1080(+)
MAGARARKILYMLDADGSGELEQDEMEVALQNKEFVSILRELEVPILDAESLIRLFDLSGDGAISASELVDGICSMAEDISPKDYSKIGMWSYSLLLRTIALEKRVCVIEQEIVTMRLKLEIAFEALQNFIETRDSSELYYRALKIVRSAPAAMPATLDEALGKAESKSRPMEKQTESLLTFAQRYIPPYAPPRMRSPVGKRSRSAMSHATSPRSPPTVSVNGRSRSVGFVLPGYADPPASRSGIRTAATLVNSRAVLGDAPDPIPVARRKRAEEEKKWVSKQLGLDADTGFQVKPEIRKLKNLLSTQD